MPGLLNAVSFNEKRKVNYFKFFRNWSSTFFVKKYNKEEETLGLVW